MMAKDHAALEKVPGKDAPYYETKSGRFSIPEQRQIDEIRCHANLRERKVAQKSLQRAFQANRGQDL